MEVVLMLTDIRNMLRCNKSIEIIENITHQEDESDFERIWQENDKTDVGDKSSAIGLVVQTVETSDEND